MYARPFQCPLKTRATDVVVGLCGREAGRTAPGTARGTVQRYQCARIHDTASTRVVAASEKLTRGQESDRLAVLSRWSIRSSLLGRSPRSDPFFGAKKHTQMRRPLALDVLVRVQIRTAPCRGVVVAKPRG